jgi:hypothetical protein
METLMIALRSMDNWSVNCLSSSGNKPRKFISPDEENEIPVQAFASEYVELPSNNSLVIFLS